MTYIIGKLFRYVTAFSLQTPSSINILFMTLIAAPDGKPCLPVTYSVQCQFETLFTLRNIRLYITIPSHFGIISYLIEIQSCLHIIALQKSNLECYLNNVTYFHRLRKRPKFALFYKGKLLPRLITVKATDFPSWLSVAGCLVKKGNKNSWRSIVQARWWRPRLIYPRLESWLIPMPRRRPHISATVVFRWTLYTKCNYDFSLAFYYKKKKTSKQLSS